MTAPRSARSNSVPVNLRVAPVQHHRAGLGHGLQPRREVRRFAHHRRPGGHPDAGGERTRRRHRARHGRARGRAGAHRALGVVFVRLGPAEAGEHAVAEERAT